ncbi:helicase-associated domain-containing protein [Leucobacter chinensis]|uniref:helicase-associated domain-containing protein n=1 Tax=Leucobacter chinensis TaxID=2851010 RepID=UPI001C229C6B|nr:helicase-associated domain-containing protein [Leucobacter chinensis]
MLSTVRLAQTLAGFDRAALQHLLIERDLDGEIPHLTELAIRLLNEANITRVLRRLTLLELTVLRGLGREEDATQSAEASHGIAADSPETFAQLKALGLCTDEGTLPEVQEALAGLIETHGALPAPRDFLALDESEYAETEPASDWPQRAFLEAQRAVLTLQFARETPLKLTRARTMTKVSERALCEATFAPESSVAFTTAALTFIGALRPEAQQLIVTENAGVWATLPHPTRWVALASAILKSMPQLLRAALSVPGRNLSAIIEHTTTVTYPLMGQPEREALSLFAERCEHFAITSNGVFTPAAERLLAEPADISGAIRLAHEHFPATVAGVYLQPDLSVIAPGPLDPRQGLALLQLADLTAPGLATTFMLSERSLTAALERGWSVPEMRDFFAETALTPLPQPLEYLLKDLAERHGTLEVEPLNNTDGATIVRVRDERLARELLADSRLQLLSLTATEKPTELFTRFSQPHVMALLLDARYPASNANRSRARSDDAAAHADRDEAETVRFIEQIAPAHRHDETQTQREWAEQQAAQLTEGTQGGAGLDIVPVLELAARTGETMRITVSDGKREHLLDLQPVSVSQGRLRAIDPKAQLERTVSVRAITAVEPIHNTEG